MVGHRRLVGAGTRSFEIPRSLDLELCGARKGTRRSAVQGRSTCRVKPLHGASISSTEAPPNRGMAGESTDLEPKTQGSRVDSFGSGQLRVSSNEPWGTGRGLQCY